MNAAGAGDVRFERCKHCGELIGTGSYYITRPTDRPAVSWFFHQECLEAEAVLVQPAQPAAGGAK